MNKYLILIAKWLLALPLIVFGLNKFIGFADMPPPSDETAQMFLGAMFTSYLSKLVGLVEIIGGVLLLIPKTTFIGLLILSPIVANIAAFHVAHDFPGNGIWLLTFLTFAVVAYGQKDLFFKLTNQ